MIKKIKNFICKIFGIKPEKQDEHLVLYEEVKKPKPQHCPSHLRFRKSCPTCQEIVKHNGRIKCIRIKNTN